MGGWITEIGTESDFDKCLAQFKKTFNVSGVPSLRVEKHIHANSARTIKWAWNRYRVPDVYVEETKEGFAVVLCGVITDLGHFGPLPNTQESTASLVLSCWIEHRDSLVKELNGSFSCLFYDPNKDEVTLYTDRFASRSVWFTHENDIWIVGNFPSAIAAIKRINPKIDPVGLWSLFHAGRHLGKHSLYDNMYCILAGEKAIFSNTSEAIVSKWRQRRYIPDRLVKARDWGARIAKVLQQSSQRYRKVCKRPYIFLSGGLDSRIAATAFGKPLKSVSLSTSPNAETKIASIISKVVGIEHETIIRSPYWYLNTLDAAALISSGNFFTCHTHFIVPVSDIVSQNPDAEFFLGDLLENFNKHYFSLPDDNNLTYNPQNMMDILHTCAAYSIKDPHRLGIHFREEVRNSIKKQYKEALEDYAKSLMDVSENDADCLDTFLRWAGISVTPTFNMITCLWPLAGERNIFFDNEVDEISLKIPSTLRGAGLLHKWILHHQNRILGLIPDANTFLPPVVPKSIHILAKKIRPALGRIRRGTVHNSKSKPVLKTSGSWLLKHEMYRKDSQYKKRIENLIEDENVFPSEIFDLKQIKNTWNEYLMGNISLHFDIEALLSFGNLHKMVQCNGIEI